MVGSYYWQILFWSETPLWTNCVLPSQHSFSHLVSHAVSHSVSHSSSHTASHSVSLFLCIFYISSFFLNRLNKYKLDIEFDWKRIKVSFMSISSIIAKGIYFVKCYGMGWGRGGGWPLGMNGCWRKQGQTVLLAK